MCHWMRTAAGCATPMRRWSWGCFAAWWSVWPKRPLPKCRPQKHVGACAVTNSVSPIDTEGLKASVLWSSLKPQTPGDCRNEKTRPNFSVSDFILRGQGNSSPSDSLLVRVDKIDETLDIVAVREPGLFLAHFQARLTFGIPRLGMPQHGRGVRLLLRV